MVPIENFRNFEILFQGTDKIEQLVVQIQKEVNHHDCFIRESELLYQSISIFSFQTLTNPCIFSQDYAILQIGFPETSSPCTSCHASHNIARQRRRQPSCQLAQSPSKVVRFLREKLFSIKVLLFSSALTYVCMLGGHIIAIQ